MAENNGTRSAHGSRLADIGEAGVVERIAARLGPAPEDEIWSGDDAAMVHVAEGGLLCSTDMLVERVDFDLAWCNGIDVGWKALAANASDIAAMGGRPRRAVVALALPRDAELGLVDDIVDGLASAARRWDIGLVGGDISRAAEVVVSIAILGPPQPGGPVLRSTARPGQAICVTGCLGGAAAGLRVLRRGIVPRPGEEAAIVNRVAARQLRPAARVEAARALCAAGVAAMIDLSDGLAPDCARLLAASAAGCVLDPAALPLDPDLVALAALRPDLGLDVRRLALTGGEDFELLFTIDADRLERLLAGARAGLDLTRIGTVTTGAAVLGDVELSAWEEESWDHLRSP